MYPKQYRINKSFEFSAIKKAGRRFSCPYFTLYLLKQETSNTTKIGFIVSNKEGNAVYRNKIKRRLRDLFKEWLEVKENFWLVVIGRKSITTISDEELVSIREKAFRFYGMNK